MLAQILWRGVFIAEVSCPTLYFPEASSINFRRSVRYGFGCLRVGLNLPPGQAGLVRQPAVCGSCRNARPQGLARIRSRPPPPTILLQFTG